MAKSNKYPQITSNPMVLSWACIQQEEEWQGKPTGKFSVRGAFTDIKETNALLEKLEGIYKDYCKSDDSLKNLKRKRNSLPNFGESENPNTGDLSFKFTTTSTWKNKNGEEQAKVVPVLDAKGKPYSGPIGNGSIGKVCFSVAPKCQNSERYGTALWLEAIQVLDLKVYQPDAPDAAKFGFGSEEGFTADTVEESQVNPFATEDNQAPVPKDEDF